MPSSDLIAERDRLREQLAMYQFADRWTREERQEMRLLNIAIADISAEIAKASRVGMSEWARAELVKNRFSGMPTLADAVQQIKDFYENRDR